MDRTEHTMIAQANVLTERELQILDLIIEECSSAEIAVMLGISQFTVHAHRKNMLDKIGSKGVVGLVKYWYELHYYFDQ